MQGNFGSAIGHIQSGNKILGELENDGQGKGYRHGVLRASGIPYVPTELLEDLFMRLDLSVAQVR